MSCHRNLLLFGVALAVACLLSAGARAEEARGSVVTERFVSKILVGTRTGLDAERVFQVYLPAGYAESTKRYPVIYYQKILSANSAADLEGDHISQIFVSMSQAFMPNPERPPFYCDFIMELENGQPTYQSDNARKLIAGFSLASQLDEYAPNMRALRGIVFDWSRYDPIYDHVFAAQGFTRALDSHGIDHEAEEYRGVYWIENWKEYGRYYARALPFLARHLVFEAGAR